MGTNKLYKTQVSEDYVEDFFPFIFYKDLMAYKIYKREHRKANRILNMWTEKKQNRLHLIQQGINIKCVDFRNYNKINHVHIVSVLLCTISRPNKTKQNLQQYFPEHTGFTRNSKYAYAKTNAQQILLIKNRDYNSYQWLVLI